jgi:hypothetical protein
MKAIDKKPQVEIEINPATNASKKVKSFVNRWFGYTAVVVASLVYLFWGWFDLYDKHRSLWVIIASSGIIMMFGWLINKFFRLQALIDMSNEPEILKSEDAHDTMIAKVEPFYDYADTWTDFENKSALRISRTYILASAGLSYSKFYDDNGDFISDKNYADTNVTDKVKRRRAKEINEAINKTRRLKITPLTITDLTNSESVNLDPHKMGRDKATFQRMENAKDLISKALFALVFGYFGVKMFDDPSLATLMETAIQVVMFYLFGAITYYTTTGYMTGEYMKTIIKKTRYLNKFYNWVTSNLATLKEVKQDGRNGENTTTTSGGTKEIVPSVIGTDNARGTTTGGLTTPSPITEPTPTRS